MDRKKILNRTLPLIIALGVVLIIALCITLVSGEKEAPKITDGSQTVLDADLAKDVHGYDRKIAVTKERLYERLKNGQGSLDFLLDLLDYKLLHDKGYLNEIPEEDLTKEIEEEIFGKDFKFDSEKYDEYEIKLRNFREDMLAQHAIELSKDAVKLSSGNLVVDFAASPALKARYELVCARKNYTYAEMMREQKEAYAEYIKEYEKYLQDLHEYEKDKEGKTKPAEPASTTNINVSDVKSDFEKENVDGYWTLFVKYDTKAEAEIALLQVGVKIVGTKWYKYENVDLESLKDEEGKKLYKNESDYYNKKGVELKQYEITEKLIELYNNAQATGDPAVSFADKLLQEGKHYTKECINRITYENEHKDDQAYQEYVITKADYDALPAGLKAKHSQYLLAEDDYNNLPAGEKELFVKNSDGKYEAYRTYKAIIFKTDGDCKDLYYSHERLNKIDSSILNYIESLSALYAGAKWEQAYTKSIQAKGSYYILGVKLQVEAAQKFSDVYGAMYDEDKFKEDGTIADLGYVTYTKDGDKFDFAYDASPYWDVVAKLLLKGVTKDKIKSHMDKLYLENDLIIYDAQMEKAYLAEHQSEYRPTKKASKDIVAKITDADKNEFAVTADMLFAELNKVYGSMTATDIYQYENILYKSKIIDYGKYMQGASLADCVFKTDYALAEKGSSVPLTKWVKADDDAKVVFAKQDKGKSYDVLQRTRTNKKDAYIYTNTNIKAEADEDGAVTLTVSDDIDYLTSEAKFAGFDEQIKALKLYLASGNFKEQGYPADYGWSNFLRDYFTKFYGFKITTMDELKVYYIYEDSIREMTKELEKKTAENWNNVYLPFMQEAYDKYFSTDAMHFLIYVQGEDKKNLNPEKDTWTPAQKEGAEELSNAVYRILKKTKKDKQGKVLDEIVDAFAKAPRFTSGAGQTTAEQEEACKDLVDGYGDALINYKEEFQGEKLEISKYKTLGLKVKHENLGTVGPDKMVKNFEDALRLMWNTQNQSDEGMKKGIELEANDFYADFIGAGEYLVTEFGYHVLVVNKYKGRDVKEKDKEKKPLTVPLLDDALRYDDAKEVDTLDDYEIECLKKYYDPIKKEFSTPQWYQINVMEDLASCVNEDKIHFSNPKAKEEVLRSVKEHIKAYNGALTYIGSGYDQAMKLLKISENAMKSYLAGHENITRERLDTIIGVTEAELAKISGSSGTLPVADNTAGEIRDYEEAYNAYNAQKTLYDASK